MPAIKCFKPVDCQSSCLEMANVLTYEEVEALRLVDLENYDFQEAARSMQVSAPTFCRILKSARVKVAQSIWFGRPFVISGGNYKILDPDKACRRGCKMCWKKEIKKCIRFKNNVMED
ncbi:putative DNA-binding protein, UPF0251 family [Thermodesulfobium acidiphilum]|uniref:Putative DNA-binding protein, UPF0251 family n=1 Tax=Thermodesulfobium acidiphilum TaxID=1794699 RepID=A0A2R4W276_THEAF|nr:putative DNA-binding protein, UPF0251 family [Thermodesulfobium acidiphilum]